MRRYVLSELTTDICEDILQYIRNRKSIDLFSKTLALQLLVTENYNNFVMLQTRDLTTLFELEAHKYLKKKLTIAD